MKALPLSRLLLSLSVAVSASSSIEGDGSEPEGEMHLRGGWDAEDEDAPLGHHGHYERYLRGLAAELKIGLDDTEEFLLQRQDFLEHTRDLHEDADFLGSQVADAPGGEFVLRYKHGNVPQKSWEGVEDFKKKHGDAVVNLVSTRLSLKDALERARRLSDILEEKAYTSVGYEIYGDDLHVTAKQPRGQGQGQGMRLLTRADAASIMSLDDDHDDLLGLSLHLVGHDQEDPYQRLYEIYKAGVGGTMMLKDKNDETKNDCTSGFAVEKIGSDKQGILTAGHCFDENTSHLKYRKKKKGKKNKWITMHKEVSREDEYGDYAWCSPKDKLDMKGYFFINNVDGNAVERDEDSWELFPVNGNAKEFVKEGVTLFCYSRKREAIYSYKVVSMSGILQGLGKRSENHLVLSGQWLELGDSGGPCWGYTKHGTVLRAMAAGIIAGRNKAKDQMYLTKIWSAEEQLGVHLLKAIECDETEYPCEIPTGGPFINFGE